MKKNYETANMEITYLQESDIIVTSNLTDSGNSWISSADNTTSFQ